MVMGSDVWSDTRWVAGWGAWSVVGLVSVRASLPAISGIRGFEGLVAHISGYSSGIGICLAELRIIWGKGCR